MLHTLIIGMGRAGRGLHLPSLDKVRAAAPGLLADGPVVAFDPLRPPPDVPGMVRAESLEEAARHRPPALTVAHLCTPPQARAALLARLAGLGYRKIIVEKPLAVDLPGLAEVARIRRRWGLDVTVATHWLDSVLTRRLRTAVAAGEHGALRRIRVVQNKPRFTRSIAARDHPTAFDVELPHALAVVLSLAGGARIVDASWDDLVLGRTRVPRLGRARLRLEHAGGVRTEIDSDLTSPIRERSITLHFDRAVLVGHYPCSDADHTAQLRTVRPGGEASRTVFTDDAFPAFLQGAYVRYARSVTSMHRTLPVQVDAVRLLTEAKRLCAAQDVAGEEIRDVPAVR
ncbi:oxidoreductase, NAD-binding Rossmann fold family protein [Actinomadura verrucosospora]|uniref:Oxidoreductase, NAD-binding Rossmann fold family protein n=2 Tax=Actinomadura verrucosospora TaxID=46165 RepID=A0A7D3ZL67_ACTVE|nr:oxidoreductase, NAD-binding Rossmann fold family protein [Actinomadura verrucosospora]